MTRQWMAHRGLLAGALATLTIGLATLGYATTRPSGGVEPKARTVGSTPEPDHRSHTASPQSTVPSTPPSTVVPQPRASGPPGRTWSAWAVLDRNTGAIRGAADLDATNNTESMVKAWIAADDLRRLSEAGVAPATTELAILSRMIRDSDDKAAQSVYLRNGADAVIERLISTCGLTDTTVHHLWWSYTQMSPRDAVRMGACIADGHAAGTRWTSWLLDEMRHVRGEGRFGIVDALPAGTAAALAIKNGWTLHYAEGEWNINCLAIADDWILAVEMRFPTATGGLDHGAHTCTSIARQTVAP